MDDGVVLLCGFSEILEQCCNIRSLEQVCQSINNPDNTAVKIVAGNVLKQFSEKRVCPGNQLGSLFSVKIFNRRVMQTGCKHTVSNSLRIDISKLFRGNVVNEHFPESLQLLFQAVVCLAQHTVRLADCAGQRFFNHVSQQSGFSRHHLRQLRCRCNGLPCIPAEFLNQVDECRKVFRSCNNFSLLYLRQNDGCGKNTVQIETEIEIIGNDQV